VGAWACLPFLVLFWLQAGTVLLHRSPVAEKNRIQYNRPRAAHVWIGCSGRRQESGGTVLERECNCASRGQHNNLGNDPHIETCWLYNDTSFLICDASCASALFLENDFPKSN